jgi:hypothetical protein
MCQRSLKFAFFPQLVASNRDGTYELLFSNGFNKVLVKEVGATSTYVQIADGMSTCATLEVPNELIIELSKSGIDELDSRSDEKKKRKEATAEVNKVTSELNSAKKICTNIEQELPKSQRREEKFKHTHVCIYIHNEHIHTTHTQIHKHKEN